MMSDALWTLVQQCWSHDVAERPSMASVVERMQDGNEELRLIVRVFELLMRLYTLNPSSRRHQLSFHDCPRHRLAESLYFKAIGRRLGGDRRGQIQLYFRVFHFDAALYFITTLHNYVQM